MDGTRTHGKYFRCGDFRVGGFPAGGRRALSDTGATGNLLRPYRKTTFRIWKPAYGAPLAWYQRPPGACQDHTPGGVEKTLKPGRWPTEETPRPEPFRTGRAVGEAVPRQGGGAAPDWPKLP